MGLLRKLLAASADRPKGSVADEQVAISKGREGEAGPSSGRHVELFAEITRLGESKRVAEAYALIKAAMTERPEDPHLYFAKASVLASWGRTIEALEAYRHAETRGLAHAALYQGIASACNGLGHPLEGETWARKAVAADPRSWNAHYVLGNALQGQGRYVDAIKSYEQALAIEPSAVACLINVSNCSLSLKDYRRAEASARRAAQMDAFQAAAWTDLGVARAAMDLHAEALEAFERGQRLENDQRQNPEISFNLAVALCHEGRLDDALALYASTLVERPVPRGQYGYGETLLEAGRMVEGFANYEFRWMKEPQLSQRPHLGKPRWSGQDLDGKRILLISEQGFGDTLQFCRYARLVKDSGATVLMRTHVALRSLIETQSGIDEVSYDGDPVPVFDYYVHLASLPHIFGTDLESIPDGTPYLFAAADRMARWSTRLESLRGARIGLVWAGNPDHERDRHRSVPHDALATLGGLDGVTFVSLQKPPAGKPQASPPASLDCVDLGPELQDFADTAAVIAQLDLVICVDTAVAHLAGALGKPVWLLIPKPGEWRWMREREDSPWYPTMRIFRQHTAGDWGEVIGRVRSALISSAARRDFGPARRLPQSGTTIAQRGDAAIPAPGSATRPGMAAVAETGAGIIQYLPDERPLGESLRWYGEYLSAHLAFLLRFIGRGSTVIEVDAAPGLHALDLSRAVGDEGHLILYEPRPQAHWLLRQNVAVNRLANVTVMDRMLAGPIPDTVDATGALLTETVDDLQLDRLDWIKFKDDAGALRVLAGATQSMWRLRPLVFVAIVNAASSDQLVSCLHEFSYRCWRMETPLFNPDNYYRRNLDVFAGKTVVAMVAIPEETDTPVALTGFVEVT
jgi:tetratricopeptide (TPR) repeat protein